MDKNKKLGRLRKIDPRKYWKTEDRDFTPWLAKEENIQKELHQLYISYNALLNYFHDELVALKERIDVLSSVHSTDHFSVLECWVPHNHHTSFKNPAPGLDVLDATRLLSSKTPQ